MLSRIYTRRLLLTPFGDWIKCQTGFLGGVPRRSTSQNFLFLAAGAQRCRSCVRASAALSDLTKQLFRTRTLHAQNVIWNPIPQHISSYVQHFHPFMRRSTFGSTRCTPPTFFPVSPLLATFLLLSVLPPRLIPVLLSRFCLPRLLLLLLRLFLPPLFLHLLL